MIKIILPDIPFLNAIYYIKLRDKKIIRTLDYKKRREININITRKYYEKGRESKKRRQILHKWTHFR